RRALPAWLPLEEPSCFPDNSHRHFATAQPAARARWRRCFDLSLAFRLLARIVLLDLAIFFTCGSDLGWICALCSGRSTESHWLSADGGSDRDLAADLFD